MIVEIYSPLSNLLLFLLKDKYKWYDTTSGLMMRTGVFETWNNPFYWVGGKFFCPPFFFNNQVKISLGERWGKTFLFLGFHSFYPGSSKANKQEMNFSFARGHPSTTCPEYTKRKNRGTNSKYSFIEETHKKQRLWSSLHIPFSFLFF